MKWIQIEWNFLYVNLLSVYTIYLYSYNSTTLPEYNTNTHDQHSLNLSLIYCTDNLLLLLNFKTSCTILLLFHLFLITFQLVVATSNDCYIYIYILDLLFYILSRIKSIFKRFNIRDASIHRTNRERDSLQLYSCLIISGLNSTSPFLIFYIYIYPPVFFILSKQILFMYLFQENVFILHIINIRIWWTSLFFILTIYSHF